MVERASYKSIRDQLIALSVDIEDKSKICSLLERKIENERELLGSVDASLNAEYNEILEAEIRSHKESTGQKTSASHLLMQRKSDLVSRCHELVDAVKEQERELASEVRSVYKDAEQVIESEKKAFRSGYEDRLQKFLASKANEYKESTAKALNPEISRLQMMHEQELSSAQLSIQSQERAIQETMAGKFQSRLEEERAAAKEELKLTAKALQDKSAAEIDNMQREHRRVLQRIGEDLERDLEKHRLFLKDKSQRGRDRVHIEMQQLQTSSQQRVADLQQRHLKHIESLQEQHEQEMQALRRQAEASRKSQQAEVRRQLKRGSEGYSDSPESRSPIKSYSGKGSKGGSPSKTARSGKSSGSLRLDGLGSFSDEDEASGSGSTARDVECSAEEEIEVAAVVRAGQEERDKQLQAEIRALESETIRLERQWRARADMEEKSVLAAVAVEEENFQVRRARGQRGQGTGAGEEDAAELVVLREQLTLQLQSLRAQSDRTSEEEKEVTSEIQVYREGVAAHKARIHDKQEQHRLRLRELQLESGPRLRELREQADNLAAQIKDGAERGRRQMAALDKEHSAELAKLDNQVKTEVGRREEDIEALRDAIEAENTKIVRLERLVKQYSGSSDGGGAASNQAASVSNDSGTSSRQRSNSARMGRPSVAAAVAAIPAESDFSSNRSTASSYISAGSTHASTTASAIDRLSAPRARARASTVASGVRASASREGAAAAASSRPGTAAAARPQTGSTGSRTTTVGGLTTRTATASAVSEGLQQLRLNRTTGTAPSSYRATSSGDSADSPGRIDNVSYDLSDDEEPLPPPSWMKPTKY